LYYLDYLDLVTWHTLFVVPGGFYTMLAVSSRAGLTVPPPDGRWDTGAGAQFRVVFRPLSAAELRAARVRALASHGHYPGRGCGHCDPVREEPPLVRRVPGPDTAFSPSIYEVRADLERSRVAHGHYAPGGCEMCSTVPAAAAPVRAPVGPGPVSPPLVQRMPGPDFAPAPSIYEARAALEESRIAHGHYAPGGCRLCMSGGRADRDGEAVMV
jgi:hypothetical protein